MTSFVPAVRARRRTALAVALCAGLTVALTACAGEDPDKGTNGIGKLDATDINTKARAAADASHSVRLAGKLVSKGGTYTLNMQLNTEGGEGSVTSQESTFALLRVGDDLFLKADAGFWSHAADDTGDGDGTGDGTGGGDQDDGVKNGDGAVAGKLDGKYVKVPEDDPTYKQLRGFTDKKVLLDGLLTLHGKVNKGGRDKIAGVRTVRILGGKGEGGALDVALEGTPYPLRVARGGGGGIITLLDWGEAFPLEVPPEDDTVDYGGQLPKSAG